MQHGAVLGDAQKRIYGCKIDAAADGQKNALECSTSPINAGLSSDCCLSYSVTSPLGQFGTKVSKKSHAKSLMTFWQLEFKRNYETKIYNYNIIFAFLMKLNLSQNTHRVRSISEGRAG